MSAARGLVNRFLKGDSGLLFAYGVTNSGKTYTIYGDEKKIVFQNTTITSVLRPRRKHTKNTALYN